MNTTLEFFVSSDVYIAGHRWDDGMPVTSEVFYVMAEAADGSRWAHHARFVGAVAAVDPETREPYFEDVRPAASAKAERLLARIKAARGLIDCTYWHEARPVYGSHAYCGATEAAYEREVGDGSCELARVG